MSLLLRLRQGIQRNASDVLAVAFLAAWPFLFFWQAALRLAVFFYGDILLFFYPTHLAYAEALRQGRLPLWEPRMMAGFPLFAEGQIGALYPLHPLLYGLLPIDLATNYDILFHLAWVSVGTFLFARALNLRPAAAFVTAFSFGASGFFIARLQHMSVLVTASWLPWLMWVWERRELEPDARRRWLWLAVFALFSGIQLLGGHPQFAFSSALFIILYGLARGPRQTEPASGGGAAWREGLAEFLRRGIALGLAYGVGVLLAAVQLVPTFELANLTNRASGLEARLFNAFSLRPVHFLMLFDPFVLGNPLPLVSVEVIGYIGFLAIVLAISTLFLRRDRRVVFFVLIALLALFLGIGDQNVFYRALRHLPLFSYFRVPSRFLYWFTFAAAMLAGVAFDALLARARPSSRLTREQKALGLAFAVIIAVIVGSIPAIPVEVLLQVWQFLPWALVMVSLVVLRAAWQGRFERGTLTAIILGTCVVDLALFGAVYAKTYDSTTSVADFYRSPQSLSAIKGVSAQEGRILTSLRVYPWQSVMRESLYPNTFIIHGVPSAIGYTPLVLQRVGEYLESMSAQMANLMNIKYLLIPQVLPIDAKSEGQDVEDEFGLDPVNREVIIPPTAATKIRVVSSVAQSTGWQVGQTVAVIYLATDRGDVLRVPLRAGIDTAEWAFERTDVRRSLQYSMPQAATSFPAISAFPEEAHTGHNFLAELNLTTDGEVPVITGMYVYPKVPAGLVHIERMMLVGPNGQEHSIGHLAGRADQTLVYRTNDVAVYENPDVLPRVFLVHDAEVLDDRDAQSELLREDFQPAEHLVLADGDPLHEGGAQRLDESSRIVEYRPEQVVVSVHAARAAYLVLADTWYPGWIGRVDGRSVPLRRADLIFRAVRVEAGDHRIEFEYRPGSLYLGAATSLLGLVLLVGTVAASRRLSRVGI